MDGHAYIGELFSMGSVAMIWFAFFPPAFYRRWIENSTDTGAAERG